MRGRSGYLIPMALLLLLGSVLSACSNPNLDFIQGKWERGNVHYYDTWTFDGGQFSHQTGIDMINPRLQSGSYAVYESQGDELILDLYGLQETYIGSSEDRQQVKILINRETGVVKIGGGMYTRVIP